MIAKHFSGRRLEMLLSLPLVMLLVVAFVWPVGSMLSRSVSNGEFRVAFPQTASQLTRLSPGELPDAATVRIFLTEIVEARRNDVLGGAAGRVNLERSGMRSALLQLARRPVPPDVPDPLAALTARDPGWGTIDYWQALARCSSPITPSFLLASVDLRQDEHGSVVSMPEDQVVFRSVIARTATTTLVVTLLCAVLSYPVAYLLANASPRVSGVLMMLVLVPFWSSHLVRAIAWVVLLQNNGLMNNALRALGIVNEPFQLIYTRAGVYLAFTNMLMPLMILSLYNVMRRIDPVFMRAAHSLGAAWWLAFIRVYLPLTAPGFAAGAVLVAVGCAGYYITPLLVGGPRDQMVSYYIMYYTNQTLNWELASALALSLLLSTAVLYGIYILLVRGLSLRQAA